MYNLIARGNFDRSEMPSPKETLLFPIIVKRTWVPIRESGKSQGDLFAPDTIKVKGEWDYYAVVTNFNLSNWSFQKVLEHHAKRGSSRDKISL
jgi:hypothetical protein